MVVNSSVLLDGGRYWRRTLRTNRTYTFMECVTAIVLFDHTTRYGSTPSKFLAPRSCGHYRFLFLSLFLTWKESKVRRLLLIGLGSYIVMRVWSGLFFIREMLAFQQVPLDSPPSAELSERVASWTYWTWFREPLDIISFLCFLLALFWLKRQET